MIDHHHNIHLDKYKMILKVYVVLLDHMMHILINQHMLNMNIDSFHRYLYYRLCIVGVSRCRCGYQIDGIRLYNHYNRKNLHMWDIMGDILHRHCRLSRMNLYKDNDLRLMFVINCSLDRLLLKSMFYNQKDIICIECWYPGCNNHHCTYTIWW